MADASKGLIDLRCGDALEVLRTIESDSVDSVVTDPPYELGFMGKAWDSTGVAYSVELWREVLRVLKPGGHLLAFGGTRTFHRLACAIEDAGFEIRDTIMWVYGSGFPKSLDVSKAIDKAAGAEREVLSSFERSRSGGILGAETVITRNITAPATPEARQWSGWGTALKPACEPITVARKPLIGTVAENVLAHGTGAINVDACRVGTEVVGWGGGAAGGNTWNTENCGLAKSGQARPVLGRWPANLIHDGSDEAVRLFPVTGGGAGSAARFFYCAKASKSDRDEGCEGMEERVAGGMQGRHDGSMGSITLRRNHHPTVKPTALMRYLCRLVTPPGGIVLDPFMGSGSTGKAAMLEGFRFIGIEIDPEYVELARKRIAAEGVRSK